MFVNFLLWVCTAQGQAGTDLQPTGETTQLNSTKHTPPVNATFQSGHSTRNHAGSARFVGRDACRVGIAPFRSRLPRCSVGCPQPNSASFVRKKTVFWTLFLSFSPCFLPLFCRTNPTRFLHNTFIANNL